jgi:hypothetical protein
MGEEKKCTRFLVENNEGKRQFGRPRHRLDYEIRVEFWILAGNFGVESVGSGWGRWQSLLKAVTNLRVLSPRG